MKEPVSREALRAMYAPMDEAFQERMTVLIRSLPEKQEERRPRRRLTVGLVFALILALAVIGSLAAVGDWNVLDFLFRSRENAASTLVQEVNAEATDGQTTLTISSAVTDGDTLALDWTVHNSELDKPVFLVVDDFTVNGVRVWTDGTDEFDNEWLPGCFSKDGWMRGGETVALPEEAKESDILHVEMVVGAYHPAREVYEMEEYDPALGKQKLEEGYLVIPEGEGFLAADEEEETGVLWVARAPGEYILANGFTRTEITVAFDLDAQAGRQSARTLETEPEYRMGGFMARYAAAHLSPLGLRLTLEIGRGDGEWTDGFDFRLTDGEGKELETPWPEGIYSERPEDARFDDRVELIYYGLTEDMLPDVISLTFFPEDGSAPVVFPIRVR